MPLLVQWKYLERFIFKRVRSNKTCNGLNELLRRLFGPTKSQIFATRLLTSDIPSHGTYGDRLTIRGRRTSDALVKALPVVGLVVKFVIFLSKNNGRLVFSRLIYQPKTIFDYKTTTPLLFLRRLQDDRVILMIYYKVTLCCSK